MTRYKLQQAVLAAILEISSKEEDAYIKSIVNNIYARHNVEDWEKPSLEKRIRRMLKTLCFEGVIHEHEGERSAQRIIKLYYSIKIEIVMNMAKMLWSVAAPMLGGKEGAIKKGKELFLDNEDKLAEGILKREQDLKETGEIPNLPTHSICFGVTAMGDKVLVMESYVWQGDDGNLNTKIVKKYNAEQFVQLIIDLIEMGLKEKDGATTK